jgi:hypothetical protein
MIHFSKIVKTVKAVWAWIRLIRETLQRCTSPHLVGIFSLFRLRDSANLPATEGSAKTATCPTPNVGPSKVQAESATCTIHLEPQVGLETVGFGASAEVYKINDYIVLKSPRVFRPPNHDTPNRDRWFYADASLFHFNLMRNERTVLRLIEQRSHPNIVEPVNTDYSEGIYLRKYLPLS